MAEAFKDHFSGVAAGYRAYRPGYPEPLFEWLAAAAPGRGRAVDLGCGTGQASVALAERFAEVVALDPSGEQIARAEPHPRVRYGVAPAEETGLPDGSVDLAIAAQALHWFDPDRLYPELRRIGRPGALFAAFTYDLCRVDPGVDAVIGPFYREVIGPYWPPERAHVDAGYRTLPFPLPEIETPTFLLEEHWDLDHLIGYLGTWSAVSAFRKVAGSDPIALIREPLASAWGPPKQRRPVRWRLTLRAGRMGR